nr:MAG TPA: hypothetical protein [Caudoviricetes sp.]
MCFNQTVTHFRLLLCYVYKKSYKIHANTLL